MASIIAKNINMDFESGESKIRVLHDVNISIEPRKLTMLVGPSGCGKTTLLSILTGILTPTSGSVIIDGQNILDLSINDKTLFRQKNIGFIFQQYNLLPALTSAENVAIPLLAQGMKFEEAVERAKVKLDSMGILHHSDKKHILLSGGEQQRVAIARSLVHDPKFIVCDEPTASLDEKTGIKIIKILSDISKKEDKIVVIVTHDNRIFKYADTIVTMNDGRILDNATK